ncbi:hypothetical protein OG756_33130 [Streptomyces sp. NBC_01310]|uniref:hypothetical protein n=1 Tax=Streptomyces sp. NBC_01310 TaxID=2903820 RepID=UPI0035B6008C|nr:hypothetical protein OG756_33130 [Streptomyces sp. NBC_01310]
MPGGDAGRVTVGPLFLYLGMITLLATLRDPGVVRSLVLFVLGTVAMAASLDLMPLGGLCYLPAFAPLSRRVPAPPARGTAGPVPVGGVAA